MHLLLPKSEIDLITTLLQKFLNALKSLKITSNRKSSKIKGSEKKCKSIVNQMGRFYIVFVFSGFKSSISFKKSYLVYFCYVSLKNGVRF